MNEIKSFLNPLLSVGASLVGAQSPVFNPLQNSPLPFAGKGVGADRIYSGHTRLPFVSRDF